MEGRPEAREEEGTDEQATSFYKYEACEALPLDSRPDSVSALRKDQAVDEACGARAGEQSGLQAEPFPRNRDRTSSTVSFPVIKLGLKNEI